jgi:sodium-dependent dicarboxylate transporter 2/3/5
MKPFQKIVLSIILGGITFVISQYFLAYNYSILLAIITMLITLWTNEGLPIGVVSLLPLILFPAFNILSVNDTAVNYSKSIIFLFLGGFMLAIATEKTGLHKVIANKLMSIFPKTPWGILFSVSLASALLSSVISNTTTALLLVPVATFLTKNKKLTIRLLLAVAFGASIGGIITPIGTPPNLIFMGFLDDHQLPSIPFMQWVEFMLPLAIIMLFLMSWIMSRGINKEDLEINIEWVPYTREHKRLVTILVLLLLLLLANSPIKPYYNGLGLNEKMILLSFGLLMFIPKIGFLEWKDSKKIPYEIIFLFGAGFSIATAFTTTGLSKELVQYLLGLQNLPLFWILIIIGAFAALLTEITSNTALTAVLLPIIFGLSSAFPPREMLLMQLVATICASYAFMLPISTPPNAIAMSTGLVKVKDMVRFGVIFDFVGIILVAVAAYFYWQILL